MTIIHISSIERVKKLLTIDGVSGATFEENNLSLSASPKAYIICDGQEIEGYVLRRRNSNLIIRTSNNDIVECRAPKWVENLQKYQYFIQEGRAYVNRGSCPIFPSKPSLRAKKIAVGIRSISKRTRKHKRPILKF